MPNSAVEIIDKLAGDNPTSEDAFERFFSWYEDYWLMNDDLVGTLDTIPRPLREVVVTHQAFGYMSSESPSEYYIRFESVFDHEVELGMVQLGFLESATTLSKGRRMFEASDDGDLTLEQDSEIYSKLPALEEVEDKIGRWLIQHANKD
ncbi:hypothetical protein LOC67_27185 [Stieleria sp. JC731]|uniref:hypothetical protein n=1 Tax=Stieleria sp. JC731 TaxID=2894195 RepID=UPI001E2F97F2|nr:hypothetical protein [Stieleria sp. JC731]MCC9604255.1 hypothetical protein [Stieleria sp. JC731]